MDYDYTAVTAESVRQETDAGLADADALVAQAVAADEVSFAARVAPLELAGARLARAYGRSAFMGHAATEAAVRDAGNEADERIAKWRAALPFRQDVYDAVRAVAESPAADELTPEQARVLFLWMRDFRRAGHALEAAERGELEQIRARLVELEVAFNRNLAEYDDAIEVTRDELAGMPDDFIERLSPGSEPGTLRVSLDYPELYPFLAQASNRARREELFRKHWLRAVDANRPLLEEALRLRQRAAELLGYPTWAHYAVEVKMAETPEAVAEFYGRLLPRLTTVRDHELDALTDRFHADGHDGRLAAWDWAYYDEQMRRSDYGVDASLVAEYLPMDACLEGMFTLTAEVFGLEYRRLPETNAWHESVEHYEIRDRASGEVIAEFFADWFPREGKFGHAAAFPLIIGHRRADGGYERPVERHPGQLHPALGGSPRAHPAQRAGDPVPRVRAHPPHVPHPLRLHADQRRGDGDRLRGGPVPDHGALDLPGRGRGAVRPPLPDRRAHARRPAPPAGGGALREHRSEDHVQVFYGQIDLGIHDGRAEPDLDEALKVAFAHTGMPYPEGTFLLSGFGHPMGGYDAGYYGYLWAEVIGDDLFGRFERDGVTSPQVGRRVPPRDPGAERQPSGR